MGDFDEKVFGVFEEGGTAVSTAANYTGTTSSACNALPTAWGPGDYWVDVFPKDYLTYVCFTDQSALTATVPTATAAGAQAVGLGKPCPAGVNTPMIVPKGCTYMARIATGTTDVTVSLASDKVQSR